jgi:kynurenine formamidase
MGRFIEVSHPIVPGMKTYPGLPEPQLQVLLDYEASRARYQDKAEFYIASLHLCGNTGTYVDSPRHRYREGTDLAALSLERLADLPVELIDATSTRRAIGKQFFEGRNISGRAVLIRSDFSRHWGTQSYFSGNPYLTAEASDLLASQGAAFVGIDSLNIDDIEDPARPAHTTLLRAGTPICEHMVNLREIPVEGGRLHAVPIAWAGGATFPVRAYVIRKAVAASSGLLG